MKRTWLGLCGTLLVFLFVWQQVQSVRLGYQLELTRRQVREARERVGYQRLELERLNAPGRLAAEAFRRLGMLPPTPESLVLLGTVTP